MEDERRTVGIVLGAAAALVTIATLTSPAAQGWPLPAASDGVANLDCTGGVEVVALIAREIGVDRVTAGLRGTTTTAQHVDVVARGSASATGVARTAIWAIDAEGA